MRKLFQHIRRQPKSIRDNYALGIAGTFTSVVVLLWVIAFPTEGLLDVPKESVEKLTPFATMISESKERFASIKTALQSVSSADTQATVVTAAAATSTESIVLTEADIALAIEKASSTGSGATSTQIAEYTEVLIGTTTYSGTSSSTATTSENRGSATVE